MARVIIFSRQFLKGHPREGDQTYFIQKFWTSIKVPLPVSIHADQLEDEVRLLMNGEFFPKHHTLRAGNRWKPGNIFSPRIWGGKPYRSKQIILADDVEIKKVWNVRIYKSITPSELPVVAIDNGVGFYIVQPHRIVKEIAKNDGLSIEDFKAWFESEEVFIGQIVCWCESVEY